VLLLAVYAAVYPLLDLGVGHDAGYTDPLHAPLEFLLALPARWLFLAGALIGAAAPTCGCSYELRWLLLLVAAALVAAFAWALRETWRARRRSSVAPRAGSSPARRCRWCRSSARRSARVAWSCR
jgi:hypothetical protein